MWRNGFSGNELNPFGSHQETKQQLQLKHVDSQDDLQVYDEPYRRSLNFQFLEPGYKVAQESSSDNEQFQINETHSAWNMPSSSTEHNHNNKETDENCGAPDYYFIGTSGYDNGMFEALDFIINPQTGQAPNLYVDTRGGGQQDEASGQLHGDQVLTGDGCDVIHTGRASVPGMRVRVFTRGGDDSVFGSMASERLFLEEGNDRGFGGGGIDYLSGLRGEDYLDGGANTDLLIGGTDADTFAINLSGQTDVIMDFRHRGDKIILSAEQGNSVSASDWFIQANQSLDQSTDMTLLSAGFRLYQTTNCFNIVSASTGNIAASILATPPPTGAELFLKATGNTLEIVDEASATMSILMPYE